METTIMGSMGGCQNYGPFLRALNIRRCIIIGSPKGTIVLTTTHMIESIVLGTLRLECRSKKSLPAR